MSKAMYLPKGWRAGPDKLGRKFVHDEAGGLYVRVPKGSVLGPELLTNGDFSGGATGWAGAGMDATHILTFSGGTLRFQADTASPPLIVNQTGILVPGRVYEVRVVTSAWVSGSLKVSGPSMGPYMGGSLVFGNAVGTQVVRGVALINDFSLTGNAFPVDVTIDSISIREVRA